MAPHWFFYFPRCSPWGSWNQELPHHWYLKERDGFQRTVILPLAASCWVVYVLQAYILLLLPSSPPIPSPSALHQPWYLCKKINVFNYKMIYFSKQFYFKITKPHIYYLHHRRWRGLCFHPFLSVTCKIEDFSSIMVSRFCYSVCLSVTYRSQL